MPENASSLTQRSLANCRQSSNEILEDLDRDIDKLASRIVPRNVVPSKVLNYEVDELAQNTRIKLWLALQRNQIINPRAYAKCITYTESVDVVRRYRKISLALVDDYIDLDQRGIIPASGQGMQDPAVEYEQKETAVAFAEAIVKGVLSLPPRQQYAMLCILKNSVADIQPLMDALLKYGLDLEAVHWPQDRNELNKLRASCSIARGKLRAYLKREDEDRSIPIEFERHR
jgi:DNA-directed RNA polymerase specialized sigma24 family protein